MKKLYNLSKTLLGECKEPKLPDVESDETLANIFNKFFIDKIIKIRDSITNSSSLSAVSTTVDNLFPDSHTELSACRLNQSLVNALQQLLHKILSQHH